MKNSVLEPIRSEEVDILMGRKAQYIPGKIGSDIYFPDEKSQGNELDICEQPYPSSFPFLLLGLWTENSHICERDSRFH